MDKRSANPTFRVHFDDGTKIDIRGIDSRDVPKAAKAQHNGIIRKIKVVKDDQTQNAAS
jgi:phage regulator Rha-like protein